jgi:nitrile hydratase accessory protein
MTQLSAHAAGRVPHPPHAAERTPLPAHATERVPLPADHDDPAFAEPWQASAFALAVHLSERGAFAWSEWSAALGHEIQAAAQQGSEDSAAYYHRWLDALERLCREKGLVDAAEISRRREQWRQAYRNTPHGEPVALTTATPDPAP